MQLMKPHGTLVRGILLSAILVALPLSVKWLRLTVALKQAPSYAKGSPTAGVEILEFSDFQCPACMRAQPDLAQLLARHPGQVLVRFYHFPLRGHKWALPAHLSAECAGQQGKFWTYHDRLYQEQATWSAAEDAPQLLLRYAQEAGADMEKFVSCLRDPATERTVMAARKAGEQRSIQSTPTFFVNGKMFVGDGGLRTEGVAYVESLLKEKKS